MTEESADKKGYHLYLTMDVMKRFKKMCIEKGVPVGYEIERLMSKKLKEDEEKAKKISKWKQGEL